MNPGERSHRKRIVPHKEQAASHHPGHAARLRHRADTPHTRDERKQRVLTQGQPAMIGSIAEAVTTKLLNLYYILAPDGQVPIADDHVFGLYFHDCRFLNGYELRIAGMAPVVLATTAEEGDAAAFALTNPSLHLDDGSLVPKEEIGIRWERRLDPDHPLVRERLSFQNFGQKSCELPVTVRFRSGFEDVFHVRDLVEQSPGTCEAPVWQDGRLSFVYHGVDKVRRILRIGFSPAPHSTDSATVDYRLRLADREPASIAVNLEIEERPEDERVKRLNRASPAEKSDARYVAHDTSEEWHTNVMKVHSDSLLFNSVVERSLNDLGMLRSRLGKEHYIAAGVPWFVALFGRDSLIVAIEMLAFQRDIAAQTLRLLAGYQGRRVDHWRDEQPGKILHELRVGELARADEIPQTPFYGTVDATPLFLLLLARHADWTGDLALFKELRQPVERALAWISEWGEISGNGYVEYQSPNGKGLVNQGWKDSGNAIVQADGSLAEPPIALAEVQGYVFAAKQAMAELYERADEAQRAKELRREAADLRARFNRDFWWEEEGTFVLALQKDARQCAVVSSNAGQVLWTGIADEDKAHRTAARLMQGDMYSGWGVRTLSTNARSYNPVGYHLGTVWPHDNALIAAGYRRYGEDKAALRIFSAVTEAAMHFRHQRLPEAMAGFPRADFQIPVQYPVACHPQAWAAGAVPFLLASCLGLEPDAFNHRLKVVRPRLPDIADCISLTGVRVGAGTADLEFRRSGCGTRTRVTRTTAGLNVEITDEDEPETEEA